MALLLTVTPGLDMALVLLGAAYLIWLGACLVRGTFGTASQEPDPVTDMLEQVRPVRPGRASRGFVRGFATNMLNPKVGVF